MSSNSGHEETKMPNRVKSAREAEGISLEQFARLSGLADNTIRRVEKGGNYAPATPAKIVKAFNKIKDKTRNYDRKFLFPNG